MNYNELESMLKHQYSAIKDLQFLGEIKLNRLHLFRIKIDSLVYIAVKEYEHVYLIKESELENNLEEFIKLKINKEDSSKKESAIEFELDSFDDVRNFIKSDFFKELTGSFEKF